ncbi:MAG: ABC transporter permease [Myxococcaceae bacterium]
MRNALAIARKELGIYFTTPWAWVVLATMLGLASFFFVGMLSEFKRVQEIALQSGWSALPPEAVAYRNLTDGVVVQLWGVVMIITLFVAPFLSMRLFAEERRQKTFELLMTTPVRPLEIVIGKYLGGVGVIFATLGPTLVFPIVISIFGTGQSGSAVEWSTVLLGYGGLLLWGAACIAVGMFISSLTESQMVASFLTFAVLLPWMLLKGLAQTAEEPLRSIAGYLSFDTQLQPLMRGVLDVQTLVFFASVIVLSMFLTHRRVEAFRWAQG